MEGSVRIVAVTGILNGPLAKYLKCMILNEVKNLKMMLLGKYLREGKLLGRKSNFLCTGYFEALENILTTKICQKLKVNQLAMTISETLTTSTRPSLE